MNILTLSRVAAAVALAGIAISSAKAQSYTLTPFTGDLSSVNLSVSQLTTNSVRFDVAVNTAVSLGDLRGVFFNIANESLLSGLTITGADVTSVVKSANSVTDAGNGNNINPEGPFDIGVEIGTQGIGKDDIRSTSFVASATVPLSATQFTSVADPGPNALLFAARVTSVGANRNGSSKLGTTGPNTPGNAIPEPTSLALIAGGGLMGLVRLRRKRK